jgi:hypothetical protein
MKPTTAALSELAEQHLTQLEKQLVEVRSNCITQGKALLEVTKGLNGMQVREAIEKNYWGTLDRAMFYMEMAASYPSGQAWSENDEDRLAEFLLKSAKGEI